MDPLARRSAILINHRITTILDIGANVGQFALEMRNLVGFTGRIVSFEPLNDAFSVLQDKAASDPIWECHNMALGDTDGTSFINVSANSHSSSMLPVSPISLKIEPSISYIDRQKVTLKRLDSVFEQICDRKESIYLKLDTQGYEMKILNGALGILNRIEIIQIEASFYAVYEGEYLVGALINFLDCLGFRIISIEPGWENPETSEMLQADFIFARKPTDLNVYRN